MFLLITDEPEFLRIAHAIPERERLLWNGDWRRRLNRARREREAGAAAADPVQPVEREDIVTEYPLEEAA